MYLKALTLRGFKSFASATTLQFEPGITAVVGPNGSGKSNVVDALAWVMGEQGAKTLRGGKMDDVIFAGTAGRPPLGRAEVSLTIDNTDGALPIEYSEVTISRTLFRSGGSEYAINGSSCRLLDIQELLSDSGIGREMHVVVGQGQLDAVLRASPEDRRAFVEEAAGVLKHRKRKEKALRKLSQMGANLARLEDLTAELRRQLGPLGRQADAARKARVVQATLRDAKSRLLADDLAQLRAQMDSDQADETRLRQQLAATEAALAEARATMNGLEVEAAAAAKQASAAADVYHGLIASRERLRGLESLAGERARLLSAVEPVTTGQDPAELEAQAVKVKAAREELEAEVADLGQALNNAETARTAAESTATDAQRDLTNLSRAAADRREGQARLSGQVATARARLESLEHELARVQEAHAEALTRQNAAALEFAQLETQIVGVQEGEEGLDAAHEAAAEALETAQAAVAEIELQIQAADRDRSTWQARAETLELSLDRKDAAGTLLTRDRAQVLGSVASLLSIDSGFEEAIAAALGPLADAVAVPDLAAAVDLLEWLQGADAGRASLVIGSASDTSTNTKAPKPAVGTPAPDVVASSGPIAAVVKAHLAGIVVVQDLDEARALLAKQPDATAVTRAGELLGATTATGGAAAPSFLHLQAAYDEARAQAEQATQAAERLRFKLSGAQGEIAEAQQRYDDSLHQLHQSDAALAAVAEQLGTLGQTQRAAKAEAERHEAFLATATEQRSEAERVLAELTQRLEMSSAEPEEAAAALVTATEAQVATEAAAVAARAAEMQARLALRTAEERLRALAGRERALTSAADTERQARAKAAARAVARATQAQNAEQVRLGAGVALAAIGRSIERATDERSVAEDARAQHLTALDEARVEAERLNTELQQLASASHRDDVLRAQQTMRLEQLQQRAIEELRTDPNTLVEEFGPHLDIDGEPFVREEQEERLAKAERALSRIGTINPLALEEFAALEERHNYLSEQLTDLKKSRADLTGIVADIDKRVEQVFTQAYHDTAAMFQEVFPTLFPGGEGKLVLTDPSNMLTTGIDVEARPAGKKVKRLSLLSGGERSLTAIAFLVAIFKARPSPFLILDEVEAALDDVNLGRLLEIFRSLREHSQLIVITHQKRTMEVADALYGVTMRGDGVTTVISQRLSE